MAESQGRLCIVLHGHLPYVLHHGGYPHGETWLFEAAAETYLPLLELLDEVARANIRPGLTIGLTPVLLEQLSHSRFRSGFVAYLNQRVGRARSDARDFEAAGDRRSAKLARRWESWHEKALASFERIKGDIAAQFAVRQREGLIQILTSAATHAYLPLLLNDEMIRAQLSCGTQTSRRHLGESSSGVWLPECAYRPTDEHWKPAALYGESRMRVGLESMIAGAGLDHFFVDTRSIAEARPLGTMEAEGFRAVVDSQMHWDHDSRGWNSTLEPVGVRSGPGKASCFAFARDPGVSQQVWSGTIGYPAAGEYLEFHRKHGEHGLRYHKVTSRTTPLGEKQAYEPSDIAGKIFEHSQHFCATIREALVEYKHKTGRVGTVVAPFDAELFGHWWFEGPRFLRDVIFTLASDSGIELATTQQVLAEQPPDKVMRLPEGSWGLNGDHSVWLNDHTKWMWEIEYRAEGRFLRSLYELPWRTKPQVKQMVERSARQLLLMQASDWPFIVHSAAATDYAIQRFGGHATRFDRMMAIADLTAAGGNPGDLEKIQIAEADAHDDVFREIDLGVVEVNKPIVVEDLGTMEYRQAWAVQEKAHGEVVAGGQERILLVEHPPVITFGRRPGVDRNLIASDEQLAKIGVEVVQSDRGGDITFHGPGQLVAYPIIRLSDHHLLVGSYVRVLEMGVIAALAELGIAAAKDPEAIGVWVGNEAPHVHAGLGASQRAKKICALGVRIRRGVTLHGIALNVTTDLSYFDLIVPCGLVGRGVTSIAQVLSDNAPSMSLVKNVLSHHLIASLQSDFNTKGRRIEGHEEEPERRSNPIS